MNEMRGGIPLFARPHTPAHSDEEKIDAVITFDCEKHDATIARAAVLAVLKKLLPSWIKELSKTNKDGVRIIYALSLEGKIEHFLKNSRSLHTAQEQQR